MSDFITIYAKDKDLNTSPIRSLLRQGEKNADTVLIKLNRFYGEHDLSEFGFVIEGVNSENTLSIQALRKEYDEKSVTLTWQISENFTAVGGSLKLTLKAIDEANDVKILIDGGEVEVCGDENSKYVSAEVSESLLSQIESSIADFSAKFDSIAKEKVEKAVADYLSGEFVISSDISRIVKISQEDYDALSEPDEKTLYVVV